MLKAKTAWFSTPSTPAPQDCLSLRLASILSSFQLQPKWSLVHSLPVEPFTDLTALKNGSCPESPRDLSWAHSSRLRPMKILWPETQWVSVPHIVSAFPQLLLCSPWHWPLLPLCALPGHPALVNPSHVLAHVTSSPPISAVHIAFCVLPSVYLFPASRLAQLLGVSVTAEMGTLLSSFWLWLLHTPYLTDGCLTSETDCL